MICSCYWLLNHYYLYRNMIRADSSNDNFDGDDEGRLVIADDDLGDDFAPRSRIDPLTLKENVLNLKSDKPRKKHLRFNGMPEEEVAKRLLPDLIKEDLDILIVRLFHFRNLRLEIQFAFLCRSGSTLACTRLSKATTTPVLETISVRCLLILTLIFFLQNVLS